MQASPARSWVDGRLLAPGEPAIRADDHGLTVGDGVFETLKVSGGAPFALTRHLDRLVRSADRLGLPVDLDEVRRGIDAVLADAPAAPYRLRVTVTGGAAGLGSQRGGDRPTVIVSLAAMTPWPPTAAVAVVPWPRNERAATAGVKTTSYADNVVALRYAQERGADEAIFANTVGNLCEGSGSNVFCGYGGRLVTPPLSSGCLAGVTRDLLLAWLPRVQERDLPVEALLDADEVFLASSTRDVHPVTTVDGKPLAAAPGPLTREAAEIFGARAAADRDP